MELTTELTPIDAVPAALADGLAALGSAVYPPQPAGSPPHPSHAIEWAGPDTVVAVRAVDGRLAGAGGAQLREVSFDGAPALACGIGGMQTHPDLRNQGVARRAISTLLEHGRHRGAVVGILFCRDELLPLYGRLGWRRFEGTVLATQYGEPVTFRFNNAMTIPLDGEDRDAETLDLHGTPW